MDVKGKESGLFDVECCNGQIYKQKRRQTEREDGRSVYMDVTWTLSHVVAAGFRPETIGYGAGAASD